MSTFDAIIIGGGPAGASCGLWLELLGFRPCIIEQRSVLGGLQNDSPYPNDWIASVMGLHGEQVAGVIHDHVLSRDIPCYLNTRARGIAREANGFRVNAVNAADANISFSAPHLVLASGVRPAVGGLRASPSLLIGPGKQIHTADWNGRSVAILGGGDNAFENYEFIRDKGAATVRIYARTIRARREFLQRVPVKDVSIGSYDVDPDAMTVDGRPYDSIVVLYGWTPSLDFMGEIPLTRNSRGFVTTEHNTAETSLRNVFAIGEVAQRMHPCCVTSMADGVVVAKEIQRRIESDAIAEFTKAAHMARLEA